MNLLHYLATRQNNRIIRHLRDHPGSEPATIALTLHMRITTVQRRLHRLETAGRVTSRWESDDAFHYHAYYAT